MFREALLASIFYIGIAFAFAGVLFWQVSQQAGSEFTTAYLVEKSLSVDNLFVFLVILTQFKVPDRLHQRVLLFGIVLALVFRGLFIALGAVALSTFSFTFVLFGALLIWTGVQLARHRNEDPDPMDSVVMRRLSRRFPIELDYSSTALLTNVDGRRGPSPLLLVMIAIGATDVLFALDSIPATFGVTQEPYIVFTANAFALLGLRALFFLVKGLLDRLIYLSTGLAVILVFIGIKLILQFAHEVNGSIPKVSTPLSLAFIAGVLAIVAIASYAAVKRDPSLRAHAGRLTDPPEHHSEIGRAHV